MSNDLGLVSIRWKEYTSYDEASRDTSRGIYIHDWGHKLYYVGKLDGSSFGTRYNKAYRHWIDGCLAHGARLFIGSIEQADAKCIENVERTFIKILKPQGNRDTKDPIVEVHIAHRGEIPDYLK